MPTDVICLVSGGLDSFLSAKLLMEQGLSVLCVHMTSPFFGDAEQCTKWENQYGLRIIHHDVSEAFVNMLREGPKHGYGKTMNPCVDCKILMLREAKKFMELHGAKAIASGAVVGQRPMSQRRDVMNTILREADVRHCLIRPLSAKALDPTPVEKSGLVDRSRLLGISGRGRKEQLSLAEKYLPFSGIPTPGGGCKLTERENARRYWMVLTREKEPSVKDFLLANTARQGWRIQGGNEFWLSFGRNKRDNESLRLLQSEDDVLLRFPGIPAPLALARHGIKWPKDMLISAAKLTLSYAIKALKESPKATVVFDRGGERHGEACVLADRNQLWEPPSWECIREEIRAWQKKVMEQKRPERNGNIPHIAAEKSADAT
ncbi:MAG: tRNA(5-methylaminomethyl-2-thiouridylate) methyltransferase [Desulfovibrio sp.]|nr:tRNA(5-methylaminomethyl-2-thiouridylate) methyltransferase [Desulfovibrio sp.]